MVELVATVAIFAILTAFAGPNFLRMIKDNRLSTEIDQLNSMLNYARNSALSTNRTVAVCPAGSPGVAQCGNDWSKGYMAVVNPGQATAKILLTYNAPKTSVLASDQGAIQFGTMGVANASTHFVVCDERGPNYARTAVVYPTGFVQTSKPGIAAWNGAAAGTCSFAA